MADKSLKEQVEQNRIEILAIKQRLASLETDRPMARSGPGHPPHNGDDGDS